MANHSTQSVNCTAYFLVDYIGFDVLCRENQPDITRRALSFDVSKACGARGKLKSYLAAISLLPSLADGR